jgi:hypothetical protein
MAPRPRSRLGRLNAVVAPVTVLETVTWPPKMLMPPGLTTVPILGKPPAGGGV